MPLMRIRDAAAFLGVSDDTVRRWVESGALPAETDEVGRKVVDSYRVALLAQLASSRPGRRSPWMGVAAW